MKAVLNLQRPKSLTELVAEELRRQIIEGDMDFGESLSESRIAKQLDVSRTPVREALHRLDIEGLVTTEPQRGTYVFTIDKEQLNNICYVRLTLELSAIQLAMAYDPEGLGVELAKITEQMSEARADSDDRVYLRLDTQFHQAIFNHTGNSYLTEAYQTIASKMSALRHRIRSHEDQIEKSYQQHKEMIKAVKKGDLKILKTILDQHIGDRKGSYWRDAIESLES